MHGPRSSCRRLSSIRDDAARLDPTVAALESDEPVLRERFRAILEHPVRPGRDLQRRGLPLRPVLARLVAAQPAGDSHHVVSTFGREIDSLFLIILVITGHRLHRHPGRPGLGAVPVRRQTDAEGRPVRPAQYFHGSQRLEVIWTIIPAAILVFIALYQMGTWAEHQVPHRRAQGRRRWPRSPPGSSSG